MTSLSDPTIDSDENSLETSSKVQTINSKKLLSPKQDDKPQEDVLSLQISLRLFKKSSSSLLRVRPPGAERHQRVQPVQKHHSSF